MKGQITIWNVPNDRKANREEIEYLSDTNRMFINFYIHGTEIGEAFIDLQNAANFEIRQPNNPN